MSPGLQMWFTDDQNQWVQPSRCDSQMTKINESSPPDVIHRWPKSMSPGLQMWFTDDQNQWVQASRHDSQTKSMSPQNTKINESSTRDMIYKLPKSMSPALQTWFTNYQNQWVQPSRCDLQMTKINESRPPDVIHRWPKSMSPGLQTWFTNYQNQWQH